MPKLTPEEAQQKHAANLKASIAYMEAGIKRVTEAPTKKAAAAKSKMLMNLTKAVNDGKWEAGLNRVSLGEWQDKMINKGLGRISVGIDEAAPKTTEFYAKFFPYLDTVATKVNKMASTTLQDNIQRMITQITEVSKFKR